MNLDKRVACMTQDELDQWFNDVVAMADDDLFRIALDTLDWKIYAMERFIKKAKESIDRLKNELDYSCYAREALKKVTHPDNSTHMMNYLRHLAEGIVVFKNDPVWFMSTGATEESVRHHKAEEAMNHISIEESCKCQET